MGDELMAELVEIGERLRQREMCEMFRMLRKGEAVPDEAAGGLYVYAEVAAHTIAADVRKAADEAVTWSVADRLLEVRPSLRWFAPETAADRAYVARYGARDWAYTTHKRQLDGFAHRRLSEVWLSASLDARSARRVAAHECRHLDQHAEMCSYAAEAEARYYEDRAEEKMRASAKV